MHILMIAQSSVYRVQSFPSQGKYNLRLELLRGYFVRHDVWLNCYYICSTKIEK